MEAGSIAWALPGHKTGCRWQAWGLGLIPGLATAFLGGGAASASRNQGERAARGVLLWEPPHCRPERVGLLLDLRGGPPARASPPPCLAVSPHGGCWGRSD